MLFLDQAGTQQIEDVWFYKSDVECKVNADVNLVDDCEYYFENGANNYDCFKCKNGYQATFDITGGDNCAGGTDPDCTSCDADFTFNFRRIIAPGVF